MRRDRLRLSARRVRSLGTTHHRRLRRGFDLCGELRDSRLGERARALRLRRLSLGGGDVVIRRRGDRRVFSLATKRLLRGRRQTFDVAFHVRLLGLEFGDAFAKKRRGRVGGVLGVCVSVSDGASFRRDVEVRRLGSRLHQLVERGGRGEETAAAAIAPRLRLGRGIRVRDGNLRRGGRGRGRRNRRRWRFRLFPPRDEARANDGWRTWKDRETHVEDDGSRVFVGVQRERSRAIHGVRETLARARGVVLRHAGVSRRLKRSDERNRSGRVEVEGGPDAVRARVECEFGVREGRSPRRADVSRMRVGVCGRALAVASRDPSPTSHRRLPRAHTHDLFFYRTVIPRDTSRCAVPDAGGSVGGRGVRGRGAAASMRVDETRGMARAARTSARSSRGIGGRG